LVATVPIQGRWGSLILRGKCAVNFPGGCVVNQL
jgi:hypothetical protein